MPILTRLGLPGNEQAWAALGFTVDNGTIQIGQVTCTLGEAAWGFDETRATPELLEVPYLTATDNPTTSGEHPNGVTIVDHVVYWMPNLDEGAANLTAVLGIPPRRRFFPRGPDGPEMAFYRVGDPFIEAVGSGRPPKLAGVAFLTPDLDAAVTAIRAAGGPIGDPRPAVQGGRIAPVWQGHLNWGIALMEPKPRA
ncbi:VOC family protein [Nocardia sp. NBC_01503]|uniref:VOC family protein n=1 Tax=Nocardia sp. NBC_01503 TaxID=2975997 RepID=UPI002E7B8738|nr:VOC family protein [Nocardia sp. NBC_01503]WTL33326.1 VOC family protein [Nocardia sp. NBC_01503]